MHRTQDRDVHVHRGRTRNNRPECHTARQSTYLLAMNSEGSALLGHLPCPAHNVTQDSTMTVAALLCLALPMSQMSHSSPLPLPQPSSVTPQHLLAQQPCRTAKNTDYSDTRCINPNLHFNRVSNGRSKAKENKKHCYAPGEWSSQTLQS